MPSSKRLQSYEESRAVQSRVAKKHAKLAPKAFEKPWRQLLTLCQDPESQHRLNWLQQQFARGQRGAMESAQAEIDIASFLIDAGFTLSFVKETETRTADLECYYDHDRLFVEVTVIVPAEGDREKITGARPVVRFEEKTLDIWQDGLVKRMLARIRKKAEQLVDYCAPVVLALTLVHQEYDKAGKHLARKLDLDLQQLGGVITNALGNVPQLSGILLTLWNMQPALSQSAIRLSNVAIGEWVFEPRGRSRVRCLAWNPRANYPLETEVSQAFHRLL